MGFLLQLSHKLMSEITLHGFLLWASMGFLMPIGILTIRMSNREECRRRLKILFYIHAISQASSCSSSMYFLLFFLINSLISSLDKQDLYINIKIALCNNFFFLNWVRYPTLQHLMMVKEKYQQTKSCFAIILSSTQFIC